MSETANVKCVFVDVVGFTSNRSVEAQSDVVGLLNDVIRQALKSCKLEDEKVILIPTGDGVAAAIVDSKEWDIDIRLSVAILEQVEKSNQQAPDDMRRFALRIGVNENVDNLVSDINGRRNVAGSGISHAQRIMDKADANQILVGQTVFDRLSPREKYMSKFDGYIARGKHGATFRVYQYVDKTVAALNTDVPVAFQEKRLVKPRFTSLVAYYVAHAIKNREFLLSLRGDPGRNWTATALLFHLAGDSLRRSETSAYERAYVRTWGAGRASFAEQYKHYRAVDVPTMSDLAGLIGNVYLSQYTEYFDGYSGGDVGPIFVTSAGVRKLILEWPSIAKELDVVEETISPSPKPSAAESGESV